MVVGLLLSLVVWGVGSGLGGHQAEADRRAANVQAFLSLASQIQTRAPSHRAQPAPFVPAGRLPYSLNAPQHALDGAAQNGSHIETPAEAHDVALHAHDAIEHGWEKLRDATTVAKVDDVRGQEALKMHLTAMAPSHGLAIGVDGEF